MDRSFSLAIRKPETNSGSLYGIPNLNLYDTGEALYQLSLRANWEQIIELVQFIYMIFIYS